MRYLALLLLTLPAFADVQDRIQQDKEITVIVSKVGFSSNGTGSGIVLDATHVLTCAHMAKSYIDELFVYSYPLGTVVRAKPLYVEPETDLMILVLDEPLPVKHFARFESHYYDGEHITAVGNGLGGMQWLISQGVIAGYDGYALLSDVRINHGNSGGPWLDDDGNVVAITSYMILPKEGTGISGGISGATIIAMLERSKSKGRN